MLEGFRDKLADWRIRREVVARILMQGEGHVLGSWDYYLATPNPKEIPIAGAGTILRSILWSSVAERVNMAPDSRSRKFLTYLMA